MYRATKLLLTRTIFVVAMLALSTPTSADVWSDFHFSINPTSPTDQDTLDLSAWRWFPDSGYDLEAQSMRVDGYEIDLTIIVRDYHIGPGGIFLTVMTPVGAYFEDFGPLPAGDYQVNATMWKSFSSVLPALMPIDEATFHFTVTETAVNAPLDGDYNRNGIVDMSDYTVWRNTIGMRGAGLAADGNLDEIVDDRDYSLWKSHFGDDSGSGSTGALSATPEPSALLLTLVAAAALGLVRRR